LGEQYPCFLKRRGFGKKFLQGKRSASSITVGQ
jgi:hypothetical protein